MKLTITGLALVLMVAAQADALAACSVALNGDDLGIGCGPSDDDVEVYVEDVAQGDELVPTLFVDIGDGPVNQGRAEGLASVTVTTRGGNDEVSLRDLDLSEGLGIQVVTGSGTDKVSVGPNVLTEELFEIDTGGGGDIVALGLNVGSAIDVQVQTGSGSDSVSTFAATPLDVPGVVALRNIVINGGSGRDSMNVGPDSLVAGRRVVLVGFGVN